MDCWWTKLPVCCDSWLVDWAQAGRMELFLIRIDDGVELTKPSIDDLDGAAAASLPLAWRLGDLETWLYLGSLGRRRAQDDIWRFCGTQY